MRRQFLVPGSGRFETRTQKESAEGGSGLVITQRVGQSTIMPWPLRLACSGAVNQATGRRPFREAEKRTV